MVTINCSESCLKCNIRVCFLCTHTHTYAYTTRASCTIWRVQRTHAVHYSDTTHEIARVCRRAVSPSRDTFRARVCTYRILWVCDCVCVFVHGTLTAVFQMPLTSRTIRCVQQIQPEYINVACSRHWHRLLGHLFSNVLINHFNSITSKIVVVVATAVAVVVVSMMFSSFFRVYAYVCHKKITHQHTESHSYRYIRSLSVRRFVRRVVPRILPSVVRTLRASERKRVGKRIQKK